MSTYVVTLDEDDEGNLVFPLPQELFEGDNPWLIGDKITWEVLEDKTSVVKNISWLERKNIK